MNDEQILEICEGDLELAKKIKEAMKAINQYTTPIIDPGAFPIKDSSMGSGTFVTLNKQNSILTNYHVIEPFIKKSSSCVVVPFNEYESKKIPFTTIISFPPIDQNANDIDLSLILLPDVAVKIVTEELGKHFFNMDALRQKYKSSNSFFEEKKAIWIINGNVAEGRNEINNRKTLCYKRAGYYFVWPNLDKYRVSECSYQITPEVKMLVSYDSLECNIEVEDRKKLPRSFDGMSGSALWKIIFDDQKNTLELLIVGVATIHDTSITNEKLICRGPISIYGSLYELFDHYKKHLFI